MFRLYLILIFALNTLGISLQIDYPKLFPTDFLFHKTCQSFSYLDLEDHFQAAAKSFAPKQKFVNLNKFSELDISKSFVNYVYINFLEHDEFFTGIDQEKLEILYGLNPWDKKFFQRLKKNFDFSLVEISILFGLEESYSWVNYLSAINLIIDLQILF